jgi:hypothetical protein
MILRKYSSMFILSTSDLFYFSDHLSWIEEGERAETRPVPVAIAIRDPVADEAGVEGSLPVPGRVAPGNVPLARSLVAASRDNRVGLKLAQ